MTEEKNEINKPLIVFSLALVGLLTLIADPHLLPQEPIKSFGEGLFFYVSGLIVVPIINIWFRALWNNVIPIIFNLRKISWWESLGLSTLLTLLLI